MLREHLLAMLRRYCFADKPRGIGGNVELLKSLIALQVSVSLTTLVALLESLLSKADLVIPVATR